jgi:hypothetical protein
MENTNKKKMAILLRGQSANVFFSHKKLKTLSWENFKDKFNELINKYNCDYTIDVFMHTYDSKYLDKNKIIEFYNPKAYSITQSPHDTNVRMQALIGWNIVTSVKNVIELYFDYCNQNNQTHDLTVMFRYDWLPHLETNPSLLNPSYYNLYYIFLKYNKIHSEDNVIFTSPENLKKYYAVLLTIKPNTVGNLHWIPQHLEKDKLFDLYTGRLHGTN